MKSEKKMKVFLLLSLACMCSSKHSQQEANHKFVTGFIVTPEQKRDEDRKSREIVEIIPDATTVSTLSHFPIDCTNQRDCDAVHSETTPMPTFKPYSQEELNSFLKKYVEDKRKNPESPTNKLANIYMEEPVNVLESTKEKSKSWQLMQSQTHHHPYDDRTGWVTLEPIPWSASQIQKWEPNKRPPQIPQWDQSEYKPDKWHDKPWDKPSYQYKPTSSYKPTYDYNKPSWSDNWGSGSDIITDGRPSTFPHENPNKPWYNKPQDTKEQLPGDGDGRWVLLSSTKGYSLPQRNRAYQRALAVQPTGQQLKSHRSVRLTVLPPEDEDNTTTSHGGLLEVEKSSQTVDEAQREHAAKMLKLTTPIASKRSGKVRVYPIKVQQPKNNAMLAAVGAGMIPATMAMLLPMVLGRKRRDINMEYSYEFPYDLHSF